MTALRDVPLFKPYGLSALRAEPFWPSPSARALPAEPGRSVWKHPQMTSGSYTAAMAAASSTSTDTRRDTPGSFMVTPMR